MPAGAHTRQGWAAPTGHRRSPPGDGPQTPAASSDVSLVLCWRRGLHRPLTPAHARTVQHAGLDLHPLEQRLQRSRAQQRLRQLVQPAVARQAQLVPPESGEQPGRAAGQPRGPPGLGAGAWRAPAAPAAEAPGKPPSSAPRQPALKRTQSHVLTKPRPAPPLSIAHRRCSRKKSTQSSVQGLGWGVPPIVLSHTNPKHAAWSCCGVARCMRATWRPSSAVGSARVAGRQRGLGCCTRRHGA